MCLCAYVAVYVAVCVCVCVSAISNSGCCLQYSLAFVLSFSVCARACVHKFPLHPTCIGVFVEERKITL